MLADEYLLLGLDALSRAHKTDYFSDGHRGAAIIAAYYFCREADLESGVSDAIRALIDVNWATTALCAPFPSQAPDPAGVSRIIEGLERSMDNLRQVGHNVILPSLALKALRDLPAMATPSRVEGICRLIEAFDVADPIELDDDATAPDFGTPSAAAEFILSELLRTAEAFEGRGQGWSGHLLTYGRALLDLRELGYLATVEKGEKAFRQYVKRLRMGPLSSDIPRPERPRTDLRPHHRGYWDSRGHRSVEIGHVFKYPYGFYGLMALAEAGDLKLRCAEMAYRIF